MGDDELGLVEHVMADQAIEEIGHLMTDALPQVCRQALELGERLFQPMVDDDVATPQLPYQFDLMVAWDAKGALGFHHGAHQLVGLEDAWSSVDQIAEKDGLASLGVTVDAAIQSCDLQRSFAPFVPKCVQQPLEFTAAAMHVADDVEGAVLVLAVAPQRLALDGRHFYVLG